MPELSNAKWERFVQEYLVDMNGAQAAIRAGFAVGGAKERAYQLLSDEGVAARLRELIDARAWRTEITADRVLRELAVIGFADMADFATWGAGGATPGQSGF